MAGIIYSVSTGAHSLTGTAASTAIQISLGDAGNSHRRVKIRGFSVAFNGTSATAEPVLVRLLRQTTAGTMSSGNARVINAATETPQAAVTINATTNPTAGNVLYETLVHPQGGLNIFFPPDEMPEIPGGGRVGLELTAPANVTARSTMIVEE